MKQLFILTISTILILLSLLIYSGIYIDLSRDELEKKYAKPPSKFLNLPDGTRIHYRDEGSSNRPYLGALTWSKWIIIQL